MSEANDWLLDALYEYGVQRASGSYGVWARQLRQLLPQPIPATPIPAEPAFARSPATWDYSRGCEVAPKTATTAAAAAPVAVQPESDMWDTW